MAQSERVVSLLTLLSRTFVLRRCVRGRGCLKINSCLLTERLVIASSDKHSAFNVPFSF